MIVVSIELSVFPSLSNSEPVTVNMPLTSIKNCIFILTWPLSLLGSPFNSILPKILLYLTKWLSPSYIIIDTVVWLSFFVSYKC